MYLKYTLLLVVACAAFSCTPADCPSGTVEISGHCKPVDASVGTNGDASAPGAGANGAEAQAGIGSTQNSSSAMPVINSAPGSSSNPSSASGSNSGSANSGPSGTCPDAPGVETCDNTDNDCDGRIDEALEMECGSSAQGICRRGKKSCQAGAWSECQGAIEPTKELCDAEQLDENCDGVRNEGCACTPGATTECGKAVGNCKKGLQTCDASGAWGTQCEGETKGQAEVCDGQTDEDCDGMVDNGCECTNGATDDACVAGMGICSRGSRVCADGKWGPCESLMQKKTEVCDGEADEDCDGRLDNGCTCVNGETETCQTGRPGPCGPGTQTCSNGAWSTCKGTKEPAREACDGEDNDCDGRDDTADTDACPSGQRCANGRCMCVPMDCGVRQCGSNGCSGTCGPGCSATPAGAQPPCRSSQCDDISGTCRENRPVTCYADGDGDSHGSTTRTGMFCTSCPSGWTTKGDDCDDSNSDVYPGQAKYFSVPRSNGSFDYNCVGGDQHEQTPVPSGCGSNTCANACATSMAVPGGACGSSYDMKTCFDSCSALGTCSGNTAGSGVIRCH